MDYNEIIPQNCELTMDALRTLASDRPNLLGGNAAQLQYFLLKSLTCIDKLMDGQDPTASQRGSYTVNGNYSGDSGNSYGTAGQHFVRAHYSRDGGMQSGDAYRTGHSRASDAATMEDMMRVATPQERKVLEALKNKMF